MNTFLHYIHCKDALLDCSAPGGERCESLTWVDEILIAKFYYTENQDISYLYNTVKDSRGVRKYGLLGILCQDCV